MLCNDLSYLRLHNFKPDRVYSLEELADSQTFQLRQCEEKLAEFHETVMEIVSNACADDLDALQADMDALEASHQSDMAATGVSSSGTKRMEGARGTQYAYTIAALTRTEEWRLLNFVRMADYIICDTLHTILVTSFKVRPRPSQSAAATALAAPPSPPIEPRAHLDIGLLAKVDEHVTSCCMMETCPLWPDPVFCCVLAPQDVLRVMSQGQQTAETVYSVFQLQLLMTEGAGKLYLAPPPNEFQDKMLELLGQYHTVICNLTRLYGDGRIMDTILKVKLNGLEEGTPLADLVSGGNLDSLVSLRWWLPLTCCFPHA